MKRIVACLLLGLACSDAAAASARCHVIYGGEEFLVLLPGQDAASARLVGERLRQAVEEAVVDW